MNKCLNCGKDVKNKYCNVSCQNTHQWTGKKKSKESIRKREQTKRNKWNNFNVNCKKCNKEFEIREYNVTFPKKDKYFCSRSCANSRNWNNEDKKKKSLSAKNSEKVKLRKNNGGRKKIERVKTPCLHCGKDIIHKENEKRKYHFECWKKCSGGFREGSSRGKSGWYKGCWCDSSWELAWVIYNLDHEIKFKRNKIGFEYNFKNKKSKFYPDFIVNGEYIEVKNYNSKRLEAKLKFFPHKIKVLYKKDLKYVFDYVVGKYGENYIELYE